MSTRPNWHQYFMGLAIHASTRSADPKTQVGAVAVTVDRAVITTGYNGLTYGVRDTPEAWENKHHLVVHAEENLLAHAARGNGGLKDATVYSTHIPCLRCTRLLIQAGVRSVYYRHDNTTGYKGSWVSEQWYNIRELFQHAGVEFRRVTEAGELEPSSCNFEVTLEPRPSA